MEKENPENSIETLPFILVDGGEKLGQGRRYQFGQTILDYYEATPGGGSPLVMVSIPGASVKCRDALLNPGKDGGILINCRVVGQPEHGNISISKDGLVVSILSPRPKEMKISENGATRKVKGVEYAQSTIDVEGTPEGVRVQIRGTVDAAPRLVVPTARSSPLMFYLIEDNPKDSEKPVYHEIWAVDRHKQDLQRAKLVKGTVIEGVFYRKVLDYTSIGGDKQVTPRNYLFLLIYVSKKDSRKG